MKSIVLAALAVVAIPSVCGQIEPALHGQTRQVEPMRNARSLTVLAGRGAQIGVSISDVEKEPGGVQVDDVRQGSPAEKAGLKKSDVIVEFDGERVRSVRQFSRLVQESAPGRTVKASIVRDGRRQAVEITPEDTRTAWNLDNLDRDGLRDFDADDWRDRVTKEFRGFADRLPPMNFDWQDMAGFGHGRLGVSVDDLTPQLSTYFGATDGGVLVASVTDETPASRAGVKAGDVIVSFNGKPVHSREDLLTAVANDGEFTIGVIRDRKPMSLKGTIETRRRSAGSRPV